MSAPTGERPPAWLQARQEPDLRPADRRVETVYIAVFLALCAGAVLCAYKALGGRL